MAAGGGCGVKRQTWHTLPQNVPTSLDFGARRLTHCHPPISVQRPGSIQHVVGVQLGSMSERLPHEQPPASPPPAWPALLTLGRQVPSPGASEPTLLGAHCHLFPSLSSLGPTEYSQLECFALPPALPCLCDICIVPVSATPHCARDRVQVSGAPDFGHQRHHHCPLTLCCPDQASPVRLFLESTHPFEHGVAAPS